MAGGFHTAGLTAAFKKAGVGYVVITPNVDEKPTAAYRELYEKRLMGQSLTEYQMTQDLHLPAANMVVVRAQEVFNLWPVAWRLMSQRKERIQNILNNLLNWMDRPQRTIPLRRRATQRGSLSNKPSGDEVQEVKMSDEDLSISIAFGTSGWRGLLVPAKTTFENGASSSKRIGWFYLPLAENASRVAQAIAEVVQDDEDYKAGLPVGVGYDARPGARDFAVRVVEVLVANGIRVLLF